MRALVEPAGFAQRAQWIDREARFALTRFEARPDRTDGPKSPLEPT